jgi:hypothetical protein
VFTTSGTYPWSFVTQIFQNGQPSHGGGRKIFEVMTSIEGVSHIIFVFVLLKSRSQTFHFMGPLYEVYIFQMIRYSRACGSHQDFLDRGLQPYIEEQTTQWPKEKAQKDKQRSGKHTYKTKDRVTQTPLKTGGELMCSGMVSSSCSTPRVPFGKVEAITSKILRPPPWLGWPFWNICVTNDHGYVPLVVNTSRSFPHSRLITEFVGNYRRCKIKSISKEYVGVPKLSSHEKL